MKASMEQFSKKYLKQIIAIAVFLTIALTCILIPVCGTPKPDDYLQELDYSESLESFNNPDRGFYETRGFVVKRDGTVGGSMGVGAKSQLFHFRADLSDLSGAVNGEKDKEIPKEAIKKLDEVCSEFKAASKNIIIRFAYDPGYGGKKDCEPALKMILKHIKQVSEILTKYPQTVTAIEVGMIGPWGEMHSSRLAGDHESVNKIIDAWMKYTDDIPLLVRTPAIIYRYLGITLDDVLAGYEMPKKAYRLGLFNDGYLGSGTDLGTWTDREAETEFFSRHNYHLPYGGEVTIPGSSWHDIKNCTPEMFLMNLSYLNYEWNTTVVQTEWQKEQIYTAECGDDSLYYGQTAYKYIDNHLGYRLVLRESVFSYRPSMKWLNVRLKIDNVGFGNFYRTKNLTIYFEDGEGNVTYSHVGKYLGGEVIEISTPIKVNKGSYKVYLGINTLEKKQTYYTVRFANDLWNDGIKANLIGNFEIK